ncbi:MAG: hypothetical protein AAF639_20785 [Chloroflexota bacterium]
MKRTIFGLIAGVLVLIAILFGVYLATTGFTLVFLILGNLSSQTAADGGETTVGMAQIGAQLADSFTRLVQGLWRDRLTLLPAGLVGLVAAWSHRAGQTFYPRRLWLVSYIGVAIAIIIPAITWMTVQQAEIGALVAERPEALGWSNLMVGSSAMIIGLSLIFGLPLAYLFLMTWRWWYTRFWRIAGQPLDETNHLSDTESAFAPVQRQLVNRLGLTAAVVLIASFALLPPVNRLHSQTALTVQHGTVRLDALSTPQWAANLTIGEDARLLSIVKREGNGTANLNLLLNGNESRWQVDEWTFGRDDPDQHHRFSLETIEPGPYKLDFQQSSGVGYFEYTLSHGGGQASHVVAILMGVLLSCGFMAGLGMLWWLLVRFALIE